MTLTDYLIDIALLAIVLLQIRGRVLTTRSLLLPIGLGGWAATTYLQVIPTAGNDLVLVAGCAGVGETEVLILIAEGLSNAEIGAALYVAESTVKTHVNRIFAKTRSLDHIQAAAYAHRAGLL